MLVLSRQKTVPARAQTQDALKDAALKGGYILKDAAPEKGHKEAQVVLWATGSEVGLALSVQETLEQKGVRTRVISLPCLELLSMQSKDYQTSLTAHTGKNTLHVSIEAGITQPWQGFLGKGALHFGIDTFGASGKGDAVMKACGLSCDVVASAILKHISA